MAITFIPRQDNAIDKFSQGFNPYLQMAIQNMLNKKLDEPKAKLRQGAEQRAIEKEKREAISSVSKGEVPLSSIPENIRKILMKPRSLDTEGLTGSPENLQAMQNISPTAQISGTPDFMQRVNQAETPEIAQRRLMQAYAQQQQAINPYRAIGGQTISARDQIENLMNSGVNFENIPVQLKIQARYSSPQGSSNDLLNQLMQGFQGTGQAPQKQQMSAPVSQQQTVTTGLPAGVTEEDIQFTMKKNKLTREEVLSRIR